MKKASGPDPLQHFLETPLEKLVLRSNGEVFPDFVRGRLLTTVSEAAQFVPAYKQLLEENRLDAANLQLAQVGNGRLQQDMIAT